MIVRLLERLLAWLNEKQGLFELTGPVAVRDGSAWLRICPGEPPRWFPTLNDAEAYS